MKYESNLSDSAYQAILPLLIRNDKYGNRKKHSDRVLVDACLYILSTGKRWKDMPSDFPHYKTVYSFYQSRCQSGTWEKIISTLKMHGYDLQWPQRRWGIFPAHIVEEGII